MQSRPTLTLAGAIVEVLARCADHTAEQVYIARVINDERLYWQRSGAGIPSGQVAARAQHEPGCFRKLPADRSRSVRARIQLSTSVAHARTALARKRIGDQGEGG